MERRPAVGSKCGVSILHVCQVKDHHQERSDNNIDCSPSQENCYCAVYFGPPCILLVYIDEKILLFMLSKDEFLVQKPPASLHEKKTGRYQWALIFCVDGAYRSPSAGVHLSLTLPSPYGRHKLMAI